MKKFLPYILILIALVGLFSPAGRANAQAAPAPAPGQCWRIDQTPPAPMSTSITTRAACLSLNPRTGPPIVEWREGAPVSSPADVCTNGFLPSGAPCPQPVPKESTLLSNLNNCGVIYNATLGGCLVTLAYYVFYGLMSFLLTVSAKFFDIILALTLSSALYGPFISKAWVVVRDLSNIFFILILLYIAVKTILGLGGSEVKKMIARVIIMALLINFSMFFTKVVIDTSNILALIFYNKIEVKVVKKDGTAADINYVATFSGIKTVQDKDIAGALVSHFDPSSLLTQDFFDKIKKTTYEFSKLGFAAYVGAGALIGSWVPIAGTGVGAVAGAVGYFLSSGNTAVPIPLMLGIIVICGGIMAFAAYAFFISGISFVGRLIELWILIIFSPFAFMSSTIPLLGKVDYIGWDSWLKRLFQISFMAPIFTFFLYAIVLIIQTDPIGSLADRTPAQQGWTETLLLLVIPALITLILLLKATHFAKKGAGRLGEMLIKGTEIAMGVAGGLALGGASMGLQASVGKWSSEIAKSERVQKWTKEGRFGAGALQATSKYLADVNFDARKGALSGILGAAGKISGLNLGAASKLLVREGGYETDRKKAVEKRMKRAKEFEVSEDEKLKQNLNMTEDDLQALLNANALELSNLDKLIADKRQALSDANAQFGAGTPEAERAGRNLENSRNRKKALREGTMYAGDMDLATGVITPASAAATAKDYRTNTATGTYTYTDANGVRQTVNRTIKNMETIELVNRKQEVETENRARKWAYADRTEGGRIKKAFRVIGLQQAGDNVASRREAAHKIRMEVKIEDKSK